MSDTPTIVFALPGNEALADALATQAALVRGECSCRSFADGETYLRFLTPVAGCHVVLACTLDHPDAKLLRLLLAARILRELGAAHLVLVAPYLPYLRQDQRFHEGEGVSARHIAKLLSTHFDGLITADPHLHRIAHLEDLYTLRLRVVQAAPLIADWVSREVERPVLIGPDAESAQWVSVVAAAAGCPFRVLEKHREGDREVRLDAMDLGAVRDRRPVLVDDIIATARTQIAAIRMLAEQGLPAPLCIGVHAIFAGDAAGALAAAGASRVLSCNSIAHASNAIDLRPSLSAALVDLLAQGFDDEALDEPGC